MDASSPPDPSTDPSRGTSREPSPGTPGGPPEVGPGRFSPPGASPTGELDDDTLAFAHRMFDLARAGDLALADYVGMGLPVNLTDPSGNTLVMLAAYHGHASVVAALVEHGADADRANDRGQTPLAGAVFKGDPEVIEVLLAAGADPTAGAPNAVDTARMFEREDLLERLVRPGGADDQRPER